MTRCSSSSISCRTEAWRGKNSSPCPCGVDCGICIVGHEKCCKYRNKCSFSSIGLITSLYCIKFYNKLDHNVQMGKKLNKNLQKVWINGRNRGLRWCTNKILEQREIMKQVTWKNFNIAVAQTLKKIEDQKITVHQAYRSISNAGSSQGRNSYNYTEQQMFQECCMSSCRQHHAQHNQLQPILDTSRN